MLYKQRSVFSCSSLFPHFVHSEVSSYRCNNHSQCCPKNNLVNIMHLREKKATNLCSEFILPRPISLAVSHLGYMWHDASWLMGPSIQARFLYLWVFPRIWLLCILYRILICIPKCLLWSLFWFQVCAMIPITMMPCSLVTVRTYIDHGV